MTGMTFSIGIRPLGGVPEFAVAFAVAFVAVADPAEAGRAARVTGAAAFDRA
jgi:hypothetical protein